MPYNTRRKSLSLPALGIQVPSTSRAHRPSISKSSTTAELQQPPSKKAKRTHSPTSSIPPTPSSRKRSSTASSHTKSVSFADRPKSSGRAAYEITPPPSPGAEGSSKVDTSDIRDDIVIGVIHQLEKTGNRPHLMKELAAVLSTTHDSVLSSANPCALLSSRLTAYLRRSEWTVASPCPLAKELIPVHPRKVYFFLTTVPRQDIPTNSSDILSSPLAARFEAGGKNGKRIISPSLSNASVDEDIEAAEERKRSALSPSPEIDLTNHDLDFMTSESSVDFDMSAASAPPFPTRRNLKRDASSGSGSDELTTSHMSRATSPQLEEDESEFNQTATSMRLRGVSLDEPKPEIEVQEAMDVDEIDDENAIKDQTAVLTLFGSASHGLGPSLMSSPMVRPRSSHSTLDKEIKLEPSMDVDNQETRSTNGDESRLDMSWDVQQTRDVQLEDIDDLFTAF